MGFSPSFASIFMLSSDASARRGDCSWLTSFAE